MTDRHTADTINDDDLDQLYAERDRLRAGEEDGWDERVVPTPGQWIARWNQATAAQRLDVAARIIDNQERAARCFEMNHERRLDTQVRAEATLARVRAYAQHAIDAGDTGPGPTLGRILLQLLDGDTAATAATRPATWLTVGTRDLSIPTPDRPPVPCPACRRADQAGLAPAEQHDDCTKEQHQ